MLYQKTSVLGPRPARKPKQSFSYKFIYWFRQQFWGPGPVSGLCDDFPFFRVWEQINIISFLNLSAAFFLKCDFFFDGLLDTFRRRRKRVYANLGRNWAEKLGGVTVTPPIFSDLVFERIALPLFSFGLFQRKAHHGSILRLIRQPMIMCVTLLLSLNSEPYSKTRAPKKSSKIILHVFLFYISP